MIFNKKVNKLQEELNLCILDVERIQQQYDEKAFYMSLIELSKKSSMAQIKNNQINNIQFKRSTFFALAISGFSVIVTCIIFYLQFTDNYPNTKWQNTQMSTQNELLITNKELMENLLLTNSRLDSIIELNKVLIQTIRKKKIK